MDNLLQADWAALQDMRKRTVPALSAFLQAVLVPAAFECKGPSDPRSLSLPISIVCKSIMKQWNLT